MRTSTRLMYAGSLAVVIFSMALGAFPSAFPYLLITGGILFAFTYTSCCQPRFQAREDSVGMKKFRYVMKGMVGPAIVAVFASLFVMMEQRFPYPGQEVNYLNLYALFAVLIVLAGIASPALLSYLDGPLADDV